MTVASLNYCSPAMASSMQGRVMQTADVPDAIVPIATGPYLRSIREHPGYANVFKPDHLTFGLVAPLEAYPDAPWPTLARHAEAVRLVEDTDFAAIWLRDVPFYDPGFSDTGQVVDPMVYAGWLAARTSRIAIGTAGIVSPLRDPLIVAKQAASIDRLSGGRFILGLATGDRSSEFAAFGSDLGNRIERYRDALGVIRAVTEESFPHHQSQFYGILDGALDMLPKPVAAALPIVAIGRSGQDFTWLRDNTDGWLWHLSDPNKLASVVAEWRGEGKGCFRPFGYGARFDLLADADAPLEIKQATLRGGRKALIEHWKRQRAEGVNHVMLHLKPLQRPFEDAIAEMAEHVLPEFAT